MQEIYFRKESHETILDQQNQKIDEMDEFFIVLLSRAEISKTMPTL